MADIQTSTTGGDVAEKTSIQSRRVSTVTESLPVEDVAEQFSAHEEEEFGDDPLHCEDPVMHISGTGHWFLEEPCSLGSMPPRRGATTGARGWDEVDITMMTVDSSRWRPDLVLILIDLECRQCHLCISESVLWWVL